MKRALALLMLAAVLAGCASTRPPVVPSLEGKPRVPINKEKPKPVTLSPASSVNQSQGE
ncbi:conjugal transfer protein TraI [Pseudomonas aeruginosa]|nr:hypothetical protein Q007_06482 [Pseudomonas aeruginosa S54485]MCV0921285.1 hypothetical protein [Escherichia coli]RPO67821.1 conjugal transfer protein TraI [Pseudomonas aeruginosa]HBP5913458.1 conjugal transfer protein TraI [Pseudomonas aeruginosa]